MSGGLADVSDVLAGPLRHAAVAHLGTDVLDAGHHRPALTERVDDRGYRLQHAALEIETDPSVDFADLAIRLGWYDQAHFINDFRSIGCTPVGYATRYGKQNVLNGPP